MLGSPPDLKRVEWGCLERPWHHWDHRPPPKILGPPLDTKAPGSPLMYLVGPLAISDPQGFPQVGGLPPLGRLLKV